jgi:hypothetical protein
VLIPVIRYGAQRTVELSESEQREIDRILEEFAVVEQVDAEPKDGPNWEAFNVEPQDELKGTDFILRGGTWLPNNSGGHMWQGYVHWCKALTEIRRTLNNATWYVAVDDDKVEWNAASQEYIADPYAAFLVADPIEVAIAFAARMN